MIMMMIIVIVIIIIIAAMAISNYTAPKEFIIRFCVGMD